VHLNFGIRIQNWEKLYLKPKCAYIISMSVVVIFSLSNVYEFFILRFDTTRNATKTFRCLSTEQHQTWLEVTVIIAVIVPFVIILVLNLCIIYYAIKMKRNFITPSIQIAAEKKTERKKAVVFSTGLTFCFIVFNAPSLLLGK
jgi:hypothetical protein